MVHDTRDAPGLAFPDLLRSSTLEAAPVALFGAAAAALLLALSLPLWAALATVPAGAFVVRDLVHAVRNRALRRTWAASFARAVRPRELRSLDAARYRLHVRNYGGFDVVRLAPAFVLENAKSGELSAVHSASRRTMDYATRCGLQVVEHRP